MSVRSLLEETKLRLATVTPCGDPIAQTDPSGRLHTAWNAPQWVQTPTVFVDADRSDMFERSKRESL
ncbi:hypothetical protein [Halostagnicola bangensis]